MRYSWRHRPEQTDTSSRDVINVVNYSRTGIAFVAQLGKRPGILFDKLMSSVKFIIGKI